VKVHNVAIYFPHPRDHVETWQDAEKLAEDELLEIMDFTNIRHLSEKDANFPFDFVANQILPKCVLCMGTIGKSKTCAQTRCPDVEEGEYLIDVTLRTRKPVRTKRLQTWRALGYKTMLLAVLPKWRMSVLVELEDSDNWINLSPKMLRGFEKPFMEFLCPTDSTSRSKP